VVLLLLWQLVGPPSYDAVHSSPDYKCWRCLDEIAMSTPQTGWAVGEESPFLLRYANGAWSWQRGPGDPSSYGWFLVSATMVSATEGWAVGGAILHYRDGRWTKELDLGQQTVLLDDVAAASPEEAWAVGGSWYDDFGFIWRYYQGSWMQIYKASNMDIEGVSAPAPGDAGAAAVRFRSEGHPSGSSLLHYSDGTWTDAFDSPAVLHVIAMTSTTDGWAAGTDASGAGVFFHYTGGRWSQAGAIPDADPYVLSMSSTDEGWASGTAGERQNALFHYHLGSWSPVTDPVVDRVRYLRGIASPAVGEAWMVGLVDDGWRDRGVLLHYQDGKWSTLAIPKSPPEDMGQVIDTYGLIGFLFFALVGLMWAWGKSLRAPRGSDWRHWLTRVILAGGVFLVVGYLIVTALPLFADDLPIDPSRIATVAEYGLIIPATALQLFTQPAALIVSARRKSRSQALPPENAREMEIHNAGKRTD